MTDHERSEWIDNARELFNSWQASGLKKYAYIALNRDYIDRVVFKELYPHAPAYVREA